MKNITKIFTLLALTGMAFASCIEETFPEEGSVTSEQVGASASALDASMSGIPSQMCQGYLIYGSQEHEADMAYPALKIMQTEMLGDMYPEGSNSGYDWYRNWNTGAASCGPTGWVGWLPWRTQYMFIKSANDIIGTVDTESESCTDDMKGYAGMAYVCRAFAYYNLMTLYEPKDNIYTDCSKVLGLTVPKVTEATTGEEAKNNPRLPHADMVAFINSDLDKAFEFLANFTPSTKLYPSLAVAYGVRAKVALWDENYDEAAKYARLAIETFGGTPVTRAQWLDLNSGFNTANQAWMWHVHYDAENMGNLCNWTGWMGAEADWGYSSLTYPSIDRSLYDRIGDNDFRKYTFIDPAKRDFYPYESVRDDEWFDAAPDYLSLKFRCVGGNWETYSVGGVCDVPIMRIEEMYLIDAEATGVTEGVAAGVAKLNSFVQTYRDAEYSCTATALRDFQLECMWQKRIEFWGEGEGWADAKRLGAGSMQYYTGTNAPASVFYVNAKGIKPHWNFVIPDSEAQSNKAVLTTNNPDPTNKIEGAKATIDEYYPATR